MCRLSASLLFLTAAITLAQTPAQKNPPSGAVTAGQTLIAPRVPLTSAGCPVGFRANRQANPQTMLAGDARQAGPAQGLHLVLDHLTRPAIESIEVTVYGTSQKAVALPLNNFASSPGTISKTFALQRQAGDNSLSNADVWMSQVGSVRWADLISITFTDGTTWHPTGNLKCRAIPSNFLLVDK